MNQTDRFRIEKGAYSLYRLGPVAIAELLAEVANRIGGVPCILGSLAECEHRHGKMATRHPPARVATLKGEVRR